MSTTTEPKEPSHWQAEAQAAISGLLRHEFSIKEATQRLASAAIRIRAERLGLRVISSERSERSLTPIS